MLELFPPIERFLRGLDAWEVVLRDEVREVDPDDARHRNPWYGRTRSTKLKPCHLEP